LPYDQLMQDLDVTNVRELEDFLINECMYAVGIIPLQRVFNALLFKNVYLHYHYHYDYYCFVAI